MSAMHPKATDTSLRTSCGDGPKGDIRTATKWLGWYSKLVVRLTEQRLRLLQIERVKAFGEPAVNRNKQFASLLAAPEPREAHCGAC